VTSFDFNDAEPQRAGSFELIPEGTIVLVVSKLRPGGFGHGNWLKNNNDGTCLMADFEFVIDGGEYDRRKIWSMWVVEGETDGQKKAANISRSRLRAMLESAHGVDPSDDSPNAMAARSVAGWQGFDGIKFCARVGIEKGGLKDKTQPNGERYPDKNILYPVTPDDDDYIAPGPQQAGARTAGAALASAGAKAGGSAKAATAPAAKKPAWAS
jgi:hypothetical protein